MISLLSIRRWRSRSCFRVNSAGSLTGSQRLATLVSVFTRIRTCSPDGTLLAYAARVGNEEFELRVVPIDGGEPVYRMEWNDKSWRQWPPDGNDMSYVVRENGVDNVWAQPLDEGPPHQLAYFDSGEIDSNWRYSPDGTRLIVSRGQSTRDVMLIRDR